MMHKFLLYQQGGICVYILSKNEDPEEDIILVYPTTKTQKRILQDDILYTRPWRSKFKYLNIKTMQKRTHRANIYIKLNKHLLLYVPAFNLNMFINLYLHLVHVCQSFRPSDYKKVHTSKF